MADGRAGPAEEGVEGPLRDILAVIESAKARGGGGQSGLEPFVARALPEATDHQVADAAALALEIIESVPLFLVRARQEAEERGLEAVVLPLIRRAERYYLKPVDLLPEMTQGLPGLLDDSYLVVRTLENLDRGPEPFLDWDLSEPIRFLRRLLGTRTADRLDAIARRAMEDLSAQLDAVWSDSAHQA